MPVPASRRDFAGSERMLKDLDMVRLSSAVAVPGRLLGKGATGTIVHMHADGKACLVEFAEPAGFVATLPLSVLETAE